MEKFVIINKIKEIYRGGGNIIRYLAALDNRESNNVEDILISYEFQAGSYRALYENDASYREVKELYAKNIAEIVSRLSSSIESILEVGVGEATTLVPVIKYLSKSQRLKWVGGNDISWSRIKVAEEFVRDNGLEQFHFFVADIFDLPIKSDSIDVVYTCHSLEPNGGFEGELLDELYRIARKYIVLLEPDWNRASEEARNRMEYHGYVKNLPGVAREKGWEVVIDRKFPVNANPLNPTGLTIIRKTGCGDSENEANKLVCPVTHKKLEIIGNAYYSTDSMLAYPVLNGVPCLRKENAILAAKMK